MNFHECSECGWKFPITSSVRVSESFMTFFPSPITAARSLLGNYVRCPACGHEEPDPSVRFLGMPPYMRIVLFLLIFLLFRIFSSR
jgi:hypothetical protein